MSTSTDKSPSEVEKELAKENGYNTIDEACESIEESGPREDRVSIAIIRKEFKTIVDGNLSVIPKGSYIIGEVSSTEKMEDDVGIDLELWENNVAPLIGPTEEELVPIVSGDWFGRSEKIAMTPHLTLPIEE